MEFLHRHEVLAGVAAHNFLEKECMQETSQMPFIIDIRAKGLPRS